jgi:hypothetical protein
MTVPHKSTGSGRAIYDGPVMGSSKKDVMSVMDGLLLIISVDGLSFVGNLYI